MRWKPKFLFFPHSKASNMTKKNNNMKIANITLLYIYTNNSHKVGSVISMREDFLERQCVIPWNAYNYDRDKSQLTNDNC